MNDATSDDANDDATSPIDSGPDGTTNHGGDAGDAGDAGDGGGDGGDGGDAVSCAPIVQSDAGGSQCPSADGPAAGEVLVYPCGLPAVGDLDGGATADGGWASDGGHVFACMTLCNDIPTCYVTPFTQDAGADAGSESSVLVTCCP
jgi:hypothetical protein